VGARVLPTEIDRCGAIATMTGRSFAPLECWTPLVRFSCSLDNCMINWPGTAAMRDRCSELCLKSSSHTQRGDQQTAPATDCYLLLL
jgi:hypothetical protein